MLPKHGPIIPCLITRVNIFITGKRYFKVVMAIVMDSITNYLTNSEICGMITGYELMFYCHSADAKESLKI
jgi:hypothetical protein